MLKRLTKDAAIYGLSDFVTKLISFIVIPFYTRYFTVDEFGIITLAGTVASFAATFANMGLNNSVQRFYFDESNMSNKSCLITSGAVVLAVLSFIIGALLSIVVYIFKEPIFQRYSLPAYILILALSQMFFDQLAQYALDVLRLRFRPFTFIVVQFIKNGFGLLLGLYLIMALGYRIEGIFIALLVCSALACVFGYIAIRDNIAFSFSQQIAKRLVVYGYPFIFVSLAYWIFGTIDRWMLAELSSLAEVGIYSIAFKLSSAMLFVNSAFGQAWGPFALKLRADDPENYRTLFAHVYVIWLLILCVISSSLMLFSSELLRLMTTSAYYKAAPAIVLLVAGVAMQGSTQLTALGISLEMKTGIFAKVAWLTAIVNIVMNFFTIPLFGATGAAAATLVAYLMITLIYAYCSQRLHPLPLDHKRIYIIMGFAVLIISCSFLFAITTWAWWHVLIKLSILLALIGVVICSGVVTTLKSIWNEKYVVADP